MRKHPFHATGTVQRVRLFLCRHKVRNYLILACVFLFSVLAFMIIPQAVGTFGDPPWPSSVLGVTNLIVLTRLVIGY